MEKLEIELLEYKLYKDDACRIFHLKHRFIYDG